MASITCVLAAAAVGARKVFTARDIEIGYSTTIESNNYLHGLLTIGKQSHLAPSVAVYPVDHPARLMTAGVNANLLVGTTRGPVRMEPVSIAHGMGFAVRLCSFEG